MRRILFPLIFGLAGLAILLSLGIWQVQRLAWKQGVLGRDRKPDFCADPVALPQQVSKEVDSGTSRSRWPVRWNRAKSTFWFRSSRWGLGTGLSSHSAPNEGRHDSGGSRFRADDRQTDRASNRATMEVTGNLHWPDEIDGYTPEPDIDTNIWFARDVPNLAVALEAEPVLLIARSVDRPGGDTFAGGYGGYPERSSAICNHLVWPGSGLGRDDRLFPVAQPRPV